MHVLGLIADNESTAYTWAVDKWTWEKWHTIMPPMASDEHRVVRVLTCKPGRMLKIVLAQGVDPATPIGKLFKDGGIDVIIGEFHQGEVRLAVTADAAFMVQPYDFVH